MLSLRRTLVLKNIIEKEKFKAQEIVVRNFPFAHISSERIRVRRKR